MNLIAGVTITITAGSTGTVFRSRWPDVVIPPMSLPQFLLAAADRGDRPALVHGPTGRVTSYGRFAALVDRVARVGRTWFAQGPGGRDPRPELPDRLVVAYGAMAAGGVVTGINPLYTPGEIAGQLAGSGARFLVTVSAFLSTARAAIQHRAADRHRRARRAAAGALAFAELLTHGATPPDVTIDPAVDLALLPFSSGTSGLPKGVQLTHRACVANVLQQRAAICYATTDRVLGVAPFFHAVGFAVIANAACIPAPRSSRCPASGRDVPAVRGAPSDHRDGRRAADRAGAGHAPAVDRYDLSSWSGSAAGRRRWMPRCSRRVPGGSAARSCRATG